MNDPKYGLSDLDDYLSGRFSSERSAQLEEEMENNEALKKQVKDLIRAKASIHWVGREAWKGRMRPQFEKKKNSSYQLLAAAIICVLIVLGAVWWSQESKSLLPDELFTAYYEFVPALEMRGERMDSIRAYAYHLYNSKEFSLALNEMELLLESDSIRRRDEVLYFQGMSWIELGEEEKAMASFRQVQEGDFVESARFHLALLLIKTGRPDEAVGLLEDLAKEGHGKAEKVLGEGDFRSIKANINN